MQLMKGKSTIAENRNLTAQMHSGTKKMIPCNYKKRKKCSPQS